jgi:small subunit ribosomal protein S21
VKDVYYSDVWRKGGEAVMPFVRVGGSGSFENALRKFKKQCEREGILSEIKKREYYDKPSVKKKKKAIAARKKAIKSLKKYTSR